MDHPADDVDLAAAASYAHGYVRALIAFIEQLQRTVPPGVHTAAATLVAWIWGLDPDDERLKRAPHGCWPTASGAIARVDKALEKRGSAAACVAGLRRPFAPVIGQLREALAAGLPDHRGHGAAVTDPREWSGGPSIRGGTGCCWVWTGSCRRRTWSAMTRASNS